ncbi:hypothetical protein DXG03_007738 [Asterophora parasitica]|uniref:Uncharacterized protein n=1 Tax=Asterophora parasitica TaxID=117018 RepID=A0A9P7GIC4_9AGAR|nr:hypothetical protein DXG03_007738 [Asterophora parasitica]
MDAQSGESKLELRDHQLDVDAVAFAPIAAYAAIRELSGISNTDHAKRPGLYLASVARDNTIKLWDTQSGQMLRNLAGHYNWVRALAFHPSGKYLLSASDDKTIRVNGTVYEDRRCPRSLRHCPRVGTTAYIW